MSLRFGWRPTEVRDSIWKDDEALGDVPAAALKSWREDGDASWLQPHCTKGQPQIIRFRNLNPDECRLAQGPWVDPSNALEGYARVLLMCFRIGVDFGLEQVGGLPDGVKREILVKERGVMMLASPFVAQLEREYPGMVGFYGKLIYDASFLTETEKKASSPQSTPTPSKAAESTTDITDQPPLAAGA